MAANGAPVKDQTHRLSFFFVLSALAVLLSCSSPLTDRTLTSAFNRHKDSFARLAALSDARNLDCSHPNDPDICTPRGSEEILAQLKEQTGFRELQVYVRKKPSYALWVPVQVTGAVSTSSTVLGYVYSRSNMTPLVNNVWQDLEQREAYKQIADGWYLFTSN